MAIVAPLNSSGVMWTLGLMRLLARGDLMMMMNVDAALGCARNYNGFTSAYDAMQGKTAKTASRGTVNKLPRKSSYFYILLQNSPMKIRALIG